MKIDRHVKPTKLECFLNLVICLHLTSAVKTLPINTCVTLKDVWYLPDPSCAVEIPFRQCHMLCLRLILSPANELLLGFGPHSATDLKHIQMWDSLLKQDENCVWGICANLLCISIPWRMLETDWLFIHLVSVDI